MRVSVIIPVRNGEAWIGHQLKALAGQDFTGAWEVVVADNGSSDDTRAVVERFATSSPMPVHLADASARAGIAHARNTGALAASGVVLAYCDCDDRVSPGWVQAAADRVRPGLIVAGVNRELTDPQRPDTAVLNPGGVIRGQRINAFIGCNFALTRDDYLHLGGFDESLPPYGCDDIEFSVRADRAGLQVVGSEEMLLYFRQTTGMRAVARKVLFSARAEVVLWHRHDDQFADRLGLGRALAELCRLPVVVLRGRLGRNPRFLARELITRLGHVIAEVEWARGRYERTARLLTSPEPQEQC